MEIIINKVIREEDERIILSVTEDCNLWPYILMDTAYDENGRVSNINRHVYIFENQNVKCGDYVVVHTGKGENTTFTNKKGTTTFSYFWGFDSSVKMWNNVIDRALIVKVAEYKNVML